MPFSRTKTPVSYPTSNAVNPVTVGSLSCSGSETDLGFCNGDMDKTSCDNNIVGIDCTGYWLLIFSFHIVHISKYSVLCETVKRFLIRYARACSSYECFILRARRLSSKLLKQGYLVERLKSSFRKFYGRYGDLVEQYEVTLSRMSNDILTLDQQWPPYQSDFPPISWPLYRAWPSPNYEWFPWSICNGCG